MKTIKIQFSDFWTDELDRMFLYDILKQHFPIEISADPDVLIYSVYTHKHLNYRCRKVLFIPENELPDYRFCDYSIGFNYDESNKRHLRYPLFLLYGSIDGLIKKETICKADLEHKTNFCAFVISNPAASERIAFFNKLNSVRQVDSAGKAYNNMPGNWCIPPGEKFNFLKTYRFNIAFENSATPGYTTEKIFEPLQLHTIPIYWGDPTIEKDFNIRSFVHIKDAAQYDTAIERIIALDQNEDLYLEMVNQPILHGNIVPEHLKMDRLLHFFENIFYHDTKTPVSKTPAYLYNRSVLKAKGIRQKFSAKLNQLLTN